MLEEMRAMEEMKVWELVRLPPGRHAVGVKWVFKVKRMADGSVERFKARLTAKGYAQVPGQDYGETFAPVGKFTTSRVLMALAAQNRWHLHQMDVSNAFLHGTLHEEVYMQQPEGFNDGTGRVCRLRKALYGLKQSPRCWNEEVARCLLSGGFRQSKLDASLFVRGQGNSFVAVLVYVDDLMIAAAELAHMQQVKSLLQSRYRMKDLGEVSLYLGMQINRSLRDGWLELGQERYANTLAAKFQHVIEGTRPASVPMSPDVRAKIKKASDLGEPCDPTLFRSLVGSLMFAATTTRPDLAFAACTLSQHFSDPHDLHLAAATHALRYFVDTAGTVLRYVAQGDAELVGYTDSDWAGEWDRKSRGAYIFTMGGTAVSWRSAKQQTVATSSCEAEYMALSEGAKEGVWLRRLLGDLGYGPGPVPLLCDSASARSLAHNPVMHGRTKHIEVHHHFVRDMVAAGEVLVREVRTHLQDADFLTKPLSGSKHKECCKRVGLEWLRYGVEAKGGCWKSHNLYVASTPYIAHDPQDWLEGMEALAAEMEELAVLLYD
jgi:hypothetical protein